MSDVESKDQPTPPSSATPLIGNPTQPLAPITGALPIVYVEGSTIGRYVVDRLIGRGGMANIYLATDPTTKRQVAIKLMPYQFNYDEELRARFQREARVIAGLEHANVVQVYDVGEENEQLYIVMRYMSGGSLGQRLGQDFSQEEVVKIGRQIADALDDVHSKGIVHRDLKPDNILFDAEGNAYLSDFGIVKLAESKTLMTATGVSAGTPAYMSPEQIEAKLDLDGRSDTYALAIILFEMLAGRAPYIADTPIGLVAQHLFDPVPQIRTLKPDLPIVVQGVIERGMAKDREERYVTASALIDDLEAALAGRLLETRPVKSAAGRVATQPQIVEPPRRTPVWAIPAGILSLGGAAALLLTFGPNLFGGNGPTPTPQVIYVTRIVENDEGTPQIVREVVTATPEDTDVPTKTQKPSATATKTATTASARTNPTRIPPSATTAPTDVPTDSNTNGTSGTNDSGTSSSGSSTGGASSAGNNSGGSGASPTPSGDDDDGGDDGLDVGGLVGNTLGTGLLSGGGN